MQELRDSFKTESDPEKKKQLKEAIKREENRKRTQIENDRDKSIIRDLRKMNAERMKQGKPPIYLKQSIKFLIIFNFHIFKFLTKSLSELKFCENFMFPNSALYS